MIHGLNIHLARPICKCKTENLGWGLNEDGSLYVFCDTCGAFYMLPYISLTASFTFEVPYPERRKPRIYLAYSKDAEGGQEESNVIWGKFPPQKTK